MISAAANDALVPLLWCGIGGWFLFSYLLSEGNGKGRWRNFLVTAFFWLICVDGLGVVLGIVIPIVRKAGVGWRFVTWVVALPYVLCALRLRWLKKRRRAAAVEPSR